MWRRKGLHMHNCVQLDVKSTLTNSNSAESVCQRGEIFGGITLSDFTVFNERDILFSWKMLFHVASCLN